MKINIDNGNVKVKFESQNELEMNSPEHFIDVLYPYFEKLKNDDKIRFLLKLGEYFANNYIFNFALHLFLYIKNNLVTTDQQLLFELNYRMGFVYESLKDIDKAIEHSNEALRIAEERKNESHIAQCINNIGGVYYNSNQFDKAIEYDTKALNLAKKIGDKTLEGKCLLELGNSFRKQGNYLESINYYKDSLERQKKLITVRGKFIA